VTELETDIVLSAMRTGDQKPLFRMRVYPEGRALYFLVNVWPTKRAMLRHVSWCKPPFEALCSPYTKVNYRNGKGRTSPECGQINFYKKRIGSAAVAHEFAHAALAWARRVRLPAAHLLGDNDGARTHPDEERFCHALDRMIGTFIDRGYKARIF
jgi:hypothetical protein